MPETKIFTIDLGFMGVNEIIAAFAVATGDGGWVLFETGPASSLTTLEGELARAGFALADLSAIFVTHVHLDHAGAAGTLARQAGCPVWSHPEGVPHLADPGKLLASAERIYGDRMETLWGKTEPVAAAQVRGVEHRGRVVVGDLEVVGWHTPGHAVHHVAWQVGDGVVTGDVAGIRFPGCSHVSPPLPPPDIDIPTWQKSLSLLRKLSPRRLLLTHFGVFEDPPRHLDELDRRLLQWTEIAERIISAGGTQEELAAELQSTADIDMAAAIGLAGEESTAMAERYRHLSPMDANAAGLFRHVRLRREQLAG